MHKLGRHYRQPVVLIFSPPILDCNVLALNEASLLKAPPKCDHERRERSVRSAVKYSNQRAWLLCARGERPCGCRAAEQRDELAPSHVCFPSIRGLHPTTPLLENAALCITAKSRPQ